MVSLLWLITSRWLVVLDSSSRLGGNPSLVMEMVTTMTTRSRSHKARDTQVSKRRKKSECKIGVYDYVVDLIQFAEDLLASIWSTLVDSTEIKLDFTDNSSNTIRLDQRRRLRHFILLKNALFYEIILAQIRADAYQSFLIYDTSSRGYLRPLLFPKEPTHCVPY